MTMFLGSRALCLKQGVVGFARYFIRLLVSLDRRGDRIDARRPHGLRLRVLASAARRVILVSVMVVPLGG
jgi:hypothetical protein